MGKRFKFFSFKLISIGMGLAIGLFLAECGMRYYLFGLKGFSYTELNSFKPLGISGLIQRSEDDSILWEIKPNLDTLFKFKQFTTNSLGMRDKEYPLKKPIDAKRIVVIGDSFAMGSGVSDHESYAALLEEIFANEMPSVKVEVLNFGVGGYGLRNYVGVLKQKAMSFDPDLILIGFCGGNDFLVPAKAQIEGRLKLRPAVEMFYRSHLRKYYLEYSVRQKRENFQIPIPSENQMAYMEAHFKAIQKRASLDSIPVVVAYTSLIATPEVIDFMQEFVQSLGLHFVNAERTMEDTPVKDKVAHPMDGHPNAAVHAVYADNIYSFIQENGFLQK